VQLECVSATVPALAPPAGHIDSATGVVGGIQISGWAVLPTSLATPVNLAVNYGTTWVGLTADQPGATAAETAYPGAGTTHGFSALIPAPAGVRTFCLWASGVYAASILECRTLTVPAS
jgi:hypothetical protein